MAGYKRMRPYTNYGQLPAKKQRYATRQTKTTVMLKPSRYARPSRYIELKFDDGTATGTIPSTGAVALISTIANGTGASNRIGSHVSYSDIEFNWIVNQQLSDTLPQYARIYLVYDKQVNGIGVNASVILNTTTPQSLASPNVRDRFKFLWDSGIMETYYNTAAPDSAFTSANCKGTKKVSLKGLKAEFSGTGAAQADIVSGALYFLFVNTASDKHGFIETNRIQYYD